MNEQFFEQLIELSKKAASNNEVPVAALIVMNDKIIAKSSNSRINDGNPLNHAEIKCIIQASKTLKDWRLDQCDMYVTLEPCHMCKEIIKECRIKNVYYLSDNKKTINYQTKFNHVNSQLSTFYSSFLTDFFRKLR